MLIIFEWKTSKNLKRALLSISPAVLPGNIDLDHVVRRALKIGMSCLSVEFHLQVSGDPCKAVGKNCNNTECFFSCSP